MKKIEDLTSYEVVEKRQIDDIGSMSWLLRHKKTGARIALLSNDDENKVFYIGFRTPPTDSTGVPHIVEHTVMQYFTPISTMKRKYSSRKAGTMRWRMRTARSRSMESSIMR